MTREYVHISSMMGAGLWVKEKGALWALPLVCTQAGVEILRYQYDLGGRLTNRNADFPVNAGWLENQRYLAARLTTQRAIESDGPLEWWECSRCEHSARAERAERRRKGCDAARGDTARSASRSTPETTTFIRTRQSLEH